MTSQLSGYSCYECARSGDERVQTQACETRGARRSQLHVAAVFLLVDGARFPRAPPPAHVASAPLGACLARSGLQVRCIGPVRELAAREEDQEQGKDGV
jgi:hypothetical protein